MPAHPLKASPESPLENQSSDAAIPAQQFKTGITGKVVKGSIWTVIGQALPMGVSLVTTPIVVRLLGAESYGIFVLVVLIPTYVGFADFGMSLASTKFASEAYAVDDFEPEARIVHSAAFIALCSSLPLAIILIVLRSKIVSLFAVPVDPAQEMSTALIFAAITFVFNFLNAIYNTPQLTRLRMDLNSLITASARIVGLILSPIAIYYGFGFSGAIFALMSASILTFVLHFVTSSKLNTQLVKPAIERGKLRPMLTFGSSMAIAAVAGMLLTNIEKGVLAALISAQALAYYYIAFSRKSLNSKVRIVA